MSLPAATETSSTHEALAGRRLGRWAIPGCAALSIAIGAALDLTGIATSAAAGVIAALTYVVTLTLASLRTEGKRHAVDRLATTLIVASALIAATPLVAILGTVIVKGSQIISIRFLLTSMRNVDPNSYLGGAYHAILGTLEQVGIAAAVGVPLGVLTAVYLVEYTGTSASQWLARAISFFVDVMTGIPSVVVGLFVYSAFILTLGLDRCGIAASIALVILLIPVVVRSTEEMLRIVPRDLREASYALGIPKWRTILKVVLPTALAGIVTGAMLAIARVAGETAPLLLTTFFTNSINANPAKGPQLALPTYIWDQFATGTPASVARAWGGALVLITIVMLLYLAAKLVARFSGARTH